MNNPSKIEAEFSLALNSRTGRYFLCRDMFNDINDLISTNRFWRQSGANVPSGIIGNALGKLMITECRVRTKSPLLDRLIPRIQRPAPVIFTDPLQVLLYKLKPQDIVFCYDMGPVTHPDLYRAGTGALYLKLFKEIQAAKPHIIFISETSKKEYEKLYGPSYNTGTVIFPPTRNDVTEGTLEEVPGIQSPFLLTVGSVGVRKNQLRAIQAFITSGLPEKGYHYVISGGKEPGFEAVSELAATVPSVHLTGYINEAQLRWLYAKAEGFVLPSLLEGFGLPAAEAVARNVVPLVSEDSALSEITGDAAILVNPLDVSSIARGMVELASMTPQIKSQKLAALTSHVSRFKHESARESYRAVIQNALQSF